jgi:hypothetical protein
MVRAGAEQLGSYEAHSTYATLSQQAFAQGDKEAASQYILNSIEAEPTQGAAANAILEIAEHDRALGDKLIVQYIERLRAYQTANANYNLPRASFFLSRLIFPGANPGLRQPTPGAAVMRAYVSYVLETMTRREEIAPGSSRGSRSYLALIWPLLQRYAPELTGPFMALEKLSRGPGNDGSLPTPESTQERSQAQYERRLKAALEDETFEEAIIYSAIGRGDFAKARKLIDKLADGPRKAQFTDMVNMREALALVATGDLPAADRLARRLTRATSIQQVYPALIAGCGVTKDASCASALAYQALKQLRRAETAPPAPPAGIPASIFDTPRDLDPVVVSAFKLAAAVLAVNAPLGLEVLDEAVQTANASAMETAHGRTGFDAAAFKQFAAADEARARQAAETFRDPLRRVVALAALYQRQAEALFKRAAQMPKAKPNATPQQPRGTQP